MAYWPVFERVRNRLLNFAGYYYISRHYKLALSHVFSRNNYSTVLITEDDLDIAPDFFSYFSSTRYLFEKDPSIYCVSAWNDNGKIEYIDWNANTTLYRSDFFPGLGWMMTRKLWEEFESEWPDAFWDDWMREPAQRKGRQCIRPEISRTGMMDYGRKGVSGGLFFDSFLSKVKMSTYSVDFSEVNLDYLLKENFERKMNQDIAESEIVDASSIDSAKLGTDQKAKIMYTGKEDFTETAKNIGLMYELRSGVPRTAYNGIVTVFHNNRRVFLVPDPSKNFTYDWN